MKDSLVVKAIFKIFWLIFTVTSSPFFKSKDILSKVKCASSFLTFTSLITLSLDNTSGDASVRYEFELIPAISVNSSASILKSITAPLSDLL